MYMRTKYLPFINNSTFCNIRDVKNVKVGYINVEEEYVIIKNKISNMCIDGLLCRML